MKRILFSLLIVVAMTIVATANGQDWKKIDQLSTTNETQVQLVKSDDNYISIKFDFNAYKINEVKTSKGAVKLIDIPNCTRTQEKGFPDLPKISQALVIPDNAKMEVNLTKSKYVELKGFEIAPSRGVMSRDKDISEYPYIYGSVYKTNAFYPKQMVSLQEPYIIRNVRGQTVMINPVQYNPVTNVVRIYTDMIVDIVATGTDSKNMVSFNANVENDEVYTSVLKNHFINYETSSKYSPISENGKKMLIVSYGSFMDEMAAYKSWKESIGYTVTMVDYATIGSASALKTYVQNQYTQNGISYLLLVGDHAQVPSSSTSAGYSDNNYGYTAGSDHYLDLFVGRFSAENAAQLQTQVDRTIYYERDVNSSDTWFRKGVGIASNEGGSGGDDGENDETHMNNIEYDLEGYGYTISRVYQNGGNASQLSSLINQGTGIINYVGHGSNTTWASMYYSQANVNALTNVNELPFIISVACVNGNFTGTTCFAETWLRATNNGSATGAIVFCGSTINQSWASPMCAQDKMNDLLVANSYITYGGMFVNGMFQMIDEYGADGNNMADTWTVFGDPSVQMRTPGHPDGPGGSVVVAPTANFTANATTITEGESVSFTSTSSGNPTSYSWSFQGASPATSTSQSPSVTYNTAGTYQVSLTVSNEAGSDSETKPAYITVQEYVPSYCATKGNDASYEWIAKVQVGDFVNTTATNGGYADFTNQTAEVEPGSTVSVTLTPGFGSSAYTEYWKIYIDYNNDYDFEDAGEMVFSASGQAAVTGSFTVPTSASGNSRMRVSMKYNAAQTACETFSYGEVEDYTISFANIVVNPPVANFSANSTTITEGESVSFNDLSTNNPTSWSWAFTGGTPSTSSAQNPMVTYNTPGTYQVKLTATNAGGADAETKAAYITVKEAGVAEYCTSKGNNVTYEWLAGVKIGTFTNNTGANAGYGNFTAQTINLTAGASVAVTLTPAFQSTAYTEYYKIWIDYNNDGDFTDAGEEVFSASGKSAVSGNIAVASSASGTTRMRVSMKYNAAQTSCETFSYGEVEDYTVSFGAVSAPVANFIANATTVNMSQIVSFTDLSTNNPTSWSWSFAGGTPSTSSSQNPTVTYNTAGTYQVSLTATSAGGSDTETKVGYITVNENSVSYCSSKGNNSSYEWIQSIVFDDFTNASGNNGGYADFTNKTIYLTPGAATNVTLTPGNSGSAYSEYWSIWIDYNKDGDFTDAGEQIGTGNSTGAISGAINIDANATGTTRMRVSMKYNAAPTSCETFSYGEVEDYTVVFGAKEATGIANMPKNEVLIYPQPADELIHIEMSNAGSAAHVKLYNMNGQLVKVQTVSHNGQSFDLDVASQPAGIYTLQIITNGTVTSKRIAIK